MIGGGTYYVSTTGSDSNPGTKSSPWAHSPGMVGWSGNTALAPGDTVYFENTGTWTYESASKYFLNTVSDGITYDGSSWGNGTRAILRAGYDYSSSLSVFEIVHSNITVKGFDIDGNSKWVNGISMNWPSGGYTHKNISNITVDNSIVRNW